MATKPHAIEVYSPAFGSWHQLETYNDNELQFAKDVLAATRRSRPGNKLRLITIIDSGDDDVQG